MTQTITYRGAAFVPTTSVSGNEPFTLYRGANCMVRGLGTSPRIEVYPGHKDLGETYDISTETLTGTISWTANSTTITGSGAGFLKYLRPGQMILSGTEIIVVNNVIDDDSFIAERAPTTTASAQTAYYMPVLFEIDKKRGVLRRGNAILLDRKDILFVGQGELYLNGSATGFTASRSPKRLQRSSSGTYSELPFGFPEPPPTPTCVVVTTGVKGMLAGKYSFLFSWYNEATGGFSNTADDPLKLTTVPADITIVAGGGVQFDLTTVIAAKPANADGLVVWGTLSGGGVTEVNASSFANGPWYEAARIPFAGKTFVDADVNTSDDTVTIEAHRFQTGDRVYVTNAGGTLPVTSPALGFASAVFVIRDSSDVIRFAATIADAKSGTAINITTAAGGGINTVSLLDGSNKVIVEYLDAATGVNVSGDNSAPPECEWVAEFANTPFFISCLGNRIEDAEDGTSPGKYVTMSKASNIEGVPRTWRVSVGDEITGFALGVGRLFTLTANGVPFVTPTGNTEVASLLPIVPLPPFSSRPFWTKGGISPFNITVVQGEVYAWTGRQPLRSPSNADEKSVPFELGRDIVDIVTDWYDGYAFVVPDPPNQHVCFISAATRKNDAGYWISEILPLDLSVSPAQWQMPIIVSSDTQDMVISGAAVVNNRLEFLAGGRTSTGGFSIGTYRYHERSGETIPYYFAYQPTDLGEEQKTKQIRSFRITGRVTDPVIQVHGADWGGDINIDNIEAGTNSLSGDIIMPPTTALSRALKKRHIVKNLQQFVIRVAGTWDGVTTVDRIDELALEVDIHGGGQ